MQSHHRLRCTPPLLQAAVPSCSPHNCLHVTPYIPPWVMEPAAPNSTQDEAAPESGTAHPVHQAGERGQRHQALKPAPQGAASSPGGKPCFVAFAQLLGMNTRAGDVSDVGRELPPGPADQCRLRLRQGGVGEGVTGCDHLCKPGGPRRPVSSQRRKAEPEANETEARALEPDLPSSRLRFLAGFCSLTSL